MRDRHPRSRSRYRHDDWLLGHDGGPSTGVVVSLIAVAIVALAVLAFAAQVAP